MTSDIQVWIGALGTLILYSYLYKENLFYRAVEHMFIGLSAAHTVIIYVDRYLRPMWRDEIIQGRYSLLIPAVLGLLVYTRYSKGMSWVARIPISLTVGYGVGYVLAFSPLSFLKQVADNFIRFSGATPGVTINNILFFVLSMSALAYFFFTINRERYAALNWISSLGRMTIIVALGAAYGNTVQGRMSLLLGRLQFLLKDWLSDTLNILNF